MCGKEADLTKHHLIPKRIKEMTLLMYVCKDCQKKLHPENELLLNEKILRDYHKAMKSFLQKDFPEAWDKWQPIRKEFKEKSKEARTEAEVVITDDV